MIRALEFIGGVLFWLTLAFLFALPVILIVRLFL